MTCGKCGAIMVWVEDDSEFGDGHWECPNCD